MSRKMEQLADEFFAEATARTTDLSRAEYIEFMESLAYLCDSAASASRSDEKRGVPET